MDDQGPSLEQQMAAQARLREAAGIGGPGDNQRFAMGCLSIFGILILAILAWVVIIGSFLGWWVWLTWN